MRNSESVRILVVIIMALFMPSVISAQAEPVHRPVSVSFVPGFGSNGPPYTHVTSNFSLNIIGGLIGNIEGCEIGSVLNIDKGHVTGFQAAGVGNFAGGDVAGLQIAGVIDVVGGGFSVVQIAGVTNVVRGEVAGGQLAGVANIVLTHVRGVQLAGVMNFALGDVTGVQIAGTGNMVGRNSTVQIGAVNIALGETYTQVGVFNIAGHARGLQLGVVNVAEDHDGVPIGIVSIVKNGQFHVNAWTDESSLLNVGIKLGSKHVYNVYAVGLQPVGSPLRSRLGLGIGGHIPADPFFLDIDAVGYNVSEGLRFWSQEGLNMLNKLRITAGWQISPKLAITAGPTINVWVSTEEDGSDIPLFDLALYEGRSGNTWIRIWPGFSVGVQLF